VEKNKGTGEQHGKPVLPSARYKAYKPATFTASSKQAAMPATNNLV
jgi:hypothetical protein